MEKMINVYGDNTVFVRASDIVEVCYSSYNGNEEGHFVLICVKHNSGVLNNYRKYESQAECHKVISGISKRINSLSRIFC